MCAAIICVADDVNSKFYGKLFNKHNLKLDVTPDLFVVLANLANGFFSDEPITGCVPSAVFKIDETGGVVLEFSGETTMQQIAWLDELNDSLPDAVSQALLLRSGSLIEYCSSYRSRVICRGRVLPPKPLPMFPETRMLTLEEKSAIYSRYEALFASQGYLTGDQAIRQLKELHARVPSLQSHVAVQQPPMTEGGEEGDDDLPDLEPVVDEVPGAVVQQPPAPEGGGSGDDDLPELEPVIDENPGCVASTPEHVYDVIAPFEDLLTGCGDPSTPCLPELDTTRTSGNLPAFKTPWLSAAVAPQGVLYSGSSTTRSWSSSTTLHNHVANCLMVTKLYAIWRMNSAERVDALAHKVTSVLTFMNLSVLDLPRTKFEYHHQALKQAWLYSLVNCGVSTQERTLQDWLQAGFGGIVGLHDVWRLIRIEYYGDELVVRVYDYG